MEVTLKEVNLWLLSEIARQQTRVAGLADSQKELGRQIAEQQAKRKSLTEQLATVKGELAAAREETKAEQEKMAANLQEEKLQVNEKEQILGATQKDKTNLDKQLEDARWQAEPILREIDALKDEIEKLREEIALQKRLVTESTEIPKEIEKLRERLARALALKAGFLQKTAFAEELLNESTSGHKSLETKKLQEYKRLCEELLPMVFEE